jgi:hypothetical protein
MMNRSHLGSYRFATTRTSSATKKFCFPDDTPLYNDPEPEVFARDELEEVLSSQIFSLGNNRVVVDATKDDRPTLAAEFKCLQIIAGPTLVEHSEGEINYYVAAHAEVRTVQTLRVIINYSRPSGRNNVQRDAVARGGKSDMARQAVKFDMFRSLHHARDTE